MMSWTHPVLPLQDGLHKEAEWPRKGVETRKTACVKMMIWNAEKGKCAGSRVEFNALEESGDRNS